jgi:acyl-CoA thioester hydrolase
MRIDRTRLDGGVWPFRMAIDTRYSDVDRVGHVNNVAVAAILQECRTRFFRTLDLSHVPGCDVVVAALNIEFAGDLLHPGTVEVSIGVLEIGRTSIRLGQIAAQNGRPSVYAEIVQVFKDRSGPIALPPSLRAQLELVCLDE